MDMRLGSRVAALGAGAEDEVSCPEMLGRGEGSYVCRDETTVGGQDGSGLILVHDRSKAK